MNILDLLDGVYTAVYPTFANQAYLIVLEKPAAPPELSLLPLQEGRSHVQSVNIFTNAFKKVAWPIKLKNFQAETPGRWAVLSHTDHKNPGQQRLECRSCSEKLEG